jgi:hypothetical protein
MMYAVYCVDSVFWAILQLWVSGDVAFRDFQEL